MNLQEVFDSENYLKSVKDDHSDSQYYESKLDSLAYRWGHATAKHYDLIKKHGSLSHPNVSRAKEHADEIAKTYTQVAVRATEAGHSPIKLGVTRYAERGEEEDVIHPQFHKDMSWATSSKDSPYRMEEPSGRGFLRITLDNLGVYGNKPGPAHMAYLRKREPMEAGEKRRYTTEGNYEMLKASVAARAKELFESIVKRGDEYVVMNSKKTKVLGKHKSKKKANAQLAAIEISKKERMNENMYYRSDFTERLKNRVKEVKAGVKNPALDINNPADRSGAASAIRLSRQSDQDEVRKALKAIEGGSDELTSYIQTGNPVPGFLSRTDASGMKERQNLVTKLVSYKGKI